MSITAVVENDTIKLPDGVHLPDGTPVEITLPHAATPSAAPGKELKAKSPALAWMVRHAGTIETLPGDFAEHHDDYIRGRKPR